MTMNKDSFAHLVKPMDILANHEDHLVCWASQIFPIPVESGDAMSLERFRVVRKTNFIVYTIATEGVLAWLLEVHNYADVQAVNRQSLK